MPIVRTSAEPEMVLVPVLVPVLVLVLVLVAQLFEDTLFSP